MPSGGLNQSLLQDFLGKVGGGPLPYVPTVQLADFSETAIGEFIEARGVVGIEEELTTVNDRSLAIRIHPCSCGGLVIHELKLGYSGIRDTGNPVFAGFRTASFIAVRSTDRNLAVGTPQPANILNAGSRPVVANVDWYIDNQTTVSLPSEDLTALQVPTDQNDNLLDEFQLQPGLRWFVPPGQYLYLFGNQRRRNSNNFWTRASLTWREVVGPQKGA